ncbi:SurA N-terminal domain-containing protein [Pelomicrobium methylotrophicum]|uniref:Periplasmic chaperone PpiD n=1 Tax=Pelomicrobium methylotrophicum TaxID=2602750 RepID=A0A5C7EVY7_9PROT|nr:SurA N-terminal domain-containing protein [Pelomicrobium methylotrophicum]TXF11244.1 peptidylprolyl isomerase [Pelomicrobium methylotrophicum]
MFDFVRNRKRIVQVVLILIIIPFALWGVESYRMSGNTAEVAEVDGTAITQREFEEALREEQERLREALRGQVDASMLGSAQLRQAVLEQLVQQRLLLTRARALGFAVPDAQLVDLIKNIETFHKDGQFSQERYEFLLRQRGLTPVVFEERVRQEVMIRQLGDPFSGFDFVTKPIVERIIRIAEQKREVSQYTLSTEQYLSRVSVDEAAAKGYYDSHAGEFRVPEQVKVDYLVLSPDTLEAKVQVSEDEIKAYYESHKAEFGAPEERAASHILVKVGAGASSEERAAARKKAESILAQAQKDPGRFAELARKYSDDPGSAGKGGDLGLFQRGTMVKSFDDAVFSMKPGEIRGPVESEFGYHVIKLNEIKESTVRPLAEVKQAIEREVRRQKASRRLSEVAEQFSNLVYEQSESLKPAAEALGLQVETSGWIGRNGMGAPFPVNERLLEAMFSDDAIKEHRNTEAIEVRPNTLVAVRVVEHKPAATRPFEEVRQEIVQRLKRERAAEMAAKEGQALLAKLTQGEAVDLPWSRPITVSRQQPHGLPQDAVRDVFRVPAGQLPAYVGVQMPEGGFALYRVSKVIDIGEIDAPKRQAWAQQLSQLLAQEEYKAFLESVRSQAKVKINREWLQAGTEPRG